MIVAPTIHVSPVAIAAAWAGDAFGHRDRPHRPGPPGPHRPGAAVGVPGRLGARRDQREAGRTEAG